MKLHTHTKLDESICCEQESQPLLFPFLSYLLLSEFVFGWAVTPELYGMQSRNFTDGYISSGQCITNMNQILLFFHF